MSGAWTPERNALREDDGEAGGEDLPVENASLIDELSVNYLPDGVIDSSLGRVKRYDFVEVTLFIVNDPPDATPQLQIHTPQNSNLAWMNLFARYAIPKKEEEPKPDDYVIEVFGDIHQKFTVTPLRQDFYVWNQ